jgi:hypothetical protein
LDDFCGTHTGQDARATEVAFALAGQSDLQVACASAAVFHLATGCNPESLFGAFVSFLLWHRTISFSDTTAGFVFYFFSLNRLLFWR